MCVSHTLDNVARPAKLLSIGMGVPGKPRRGRCEMISSIADIVNVGVMKVGARGRVEA